MVASRVKTGDGLLVLRDFPDIALTGGIHARKTEEFERLKKLENECRTYPMNLVPDRSVLLEL